MADVFRDRLEDSRRRLSSFGDRADVGDDRCAVGFDAYQDVVGGDVDLVILATPPHFRPLHFEAAIKAGKHVFMEKPVAVDPAGIRAVLAAADEADARGLCVVAGTQRRHEASYLAAMRQIHDGAIGSVVAARCYWNMGGLWMKEPRLDVVNWAVGTHPIRAQGMGGRQVRTGPSYGHIFDHFAIEFEYPDNVFLMSMCRQIDDTW
jgi:predicted dehydrogenase